MAPQIGLAIGTMLSAAFSAHEEWQCRSLSAADGYRCPTVACELTSGVYYGVSRNISVSDLLEVLCTASKDGVISELALVGFKGETLGTKKLALNENVCKPRIKTSDYLDLIVGPDTDEEPGGLWSRLIIDIDNQRVSRVVREIRTAECFWERGL